MAISIKPHDPQEVRSHITDPIVPPEGWRAWPYGGICGDHFTSQSHLQKARTVHKTPKPVINESVFELEVELSVLEALPGPEMIFIELGAGWGAQSLQITTAVRHQVVDTKVRHVTCYALEAEPGHYGFVVEAFQRNNICGLPLFGAVSDTVGWAQFFATVPSADNYGQSLRPDGNLTVPTFTLANLVETFGLESVDLVHMDIQGAEPEAIRGALPVIDRFRILLVCPHYEEHVSQIVSMLMPTHKPVISLGPRSGYHDLPGFSLPVHMPQDGLMVWERR